MNLKEIAAQQALEFIQSGMNLGLGSGSTMVIFTGLLGEALRLGKFQDIRVVPTSNTVRKLAIEHGIPLASLADIPFLDLAIDGADEVAPNLDLIKGLGKALLREKVVAIHARQFLIIADESKLVHRLGQRVPLPVEIIQFEYPVHLRWLNSLGCRAEWWKDLDGRPVITDNGNYLALCHFEDRPGEGIPNLPGLVEQLEHRPGIVEHGLFISMADWVIISGQSGVNILERKY